MFAEVKKIDQEIRSIDASGHGGPKKFEGKRILVNDVELINWVEFLHYDKIDFQTVVCDCGNVGCISNGWVSLRRHNEFTVMIPAVHAIYEEHSIQESFPPPFINKLGPISFSPSQYANLRSLVPQLPDHKDLRYLSHLELIGCHQLTAPGFFLGRLGALPKLKRDLILAVSEGNLDEEIASLELALKNTNIRQLPEYSRPADRVVEFYLDLPKFPSWAGMGYRKGKPTLVVS